MPTKEQAMDAARVLDEWYGQLAPGTSYDDWIAYRILGVTKAPATINVDPATKIISYGRPKLEALQAAWKVATDFVKTPTTWPVWRVYDWRQALPKLTQTVRTAALAQAKGWTGSGTDADPLRPPAPLAVTAKAGAAQPAKEMHWALTFALWYAGWTVLDKVILR